MSKISAEQIRLASNGCLEPDIDGDGELRIKIKHPELLSGLQRSVDGLSVSSYQADILSIRTIFGYQKELASNNVGSLFVRFPSQSGSKDDILDADGSWVKFTGSNSSGATWGIDSQYFNMLNLYAEPVMRVRFKTGSDLTNQRIWVGFCSSDISNSDNPAASLMAIRYSTSASDTTFKCCVKDGTNMTTVDSGVTVTADTVYDMVIDASAGSEIEFYIESAVVSNITTNIPASTTPLGVVCKGTNLTSGGKHFYFAKMIGTLR